MTLLYSFCEPYKHTTQIRYCVYAGENISLPIFQDVNKLCPFSLKAKCHFHISNIECFLWNICEQIFQTLHELLYDS